MIKEKGGRETDQLRPKGQKDIKKKKSRDKRVLTNGERGFGMSTLSLHQDPFLHQQNQPKKKRLSVGFGLWLLGAQPPTAQPLFFFVFGATKKKSFAMRERRLHTTNTHPYITLSCTYGWN